MTLMNKVKKTKAISEIDEKRQLNVACIIENQSDLLENYPNRWIAVDNESIQLVDLDFFLLYRNMRNRGSNSSLVYYHAVNYNPPAILMTPVEMEYEFDIEAGWQS